MSVGHGLRAVLGDGRKYGLQLRQEFEDRTGEVWPLNVGQVYTTWPPRDELVIKVLVALRLPGVDVRDVVQVHRQYVVELMQQWTRLKDDAAEHEVGFLLVVDAELFRLDSVIRWVDAADGRL